MKSLTTIEPESTFEFKKVKYNWDHLLNIKFLSYMLCEIKLRNKKTYFIPPPTPIFAKVSKNSVCISFV